jgi:hypothetical protein
VPQIHNMEELYEALQRYGYVMPKFTCQLVNKAYLHYVLRKKFWVPNQVDVRFRNCPKPPTSQVLVEKLLHQTERRRLETGIVPAKRNFPNVEWMLLVLATLSPDDEIFTKGYMPPQRARKESIAEVALPDDPVFDGLDDVFAGRKRGKKASGNLFQTRDELLEQRIQAKQQRIEEQLAVARRMETELQTLKDRGP